METEVGVDVGAEVAVWVVEIGQGLAQRRHGRFPFAKAVSSVTANPSSAPRT